LLLPCRLILAPGTPVNFYWAYLIEPGGFRQWVNVSFNHYQQNTKVKVTEHEVTAGAAPGYYHPAATKSPLTFPHRRSIPLSNKWVTSAFSSAGVFLPYFDQSVFLKGFFFGSFFLTRYLLKKKEPRLFFRPQGSLKNGSDSGREVLFASFFFQRKSWGAFKKPYPVYYFSNL